MVEYDLTKDDTIKENILQKKSIREGATVLLTVALLMGSGEKIHALSMMEHGECGYSTIFMQYTSGRDEEF